MAELEVNVRNGRNKHDLRSLRERGGVPGVVYGKEMGSVAISLDAKQIKDIVEAGRTKLIDLHINGQKGGAHKVLVKGMQFDQLRHNLKHVDFYQVSLHDKIRTNVPVHLTGKAEGVARGGILQHDLRALEVECLPAEIPASLTMNISHLGIGDVLLVKDIALPDGVKATDHPNTVVVGVALAKAPEPAGNAEVPPEPMAEVKDKTEPLREPARE